MGIKRYQSMTKKYAEILLRAGIQFESLITSLAQAPTQSSQSGDIYQALVRFGNLGLQQQGNDVVWDVNSPTANDIFNLFDKLGFAGAMNVSVSVDANKKATVNVASSPNNPRLVGAVTKMLTPKVQSAVARIPAPAELITVPDIISARNVK